MSSQRAWTRIADVKVNAVLWDGSSLYAAGANNREGVWCCDDPTAARPVWWKTGLNRFLNVPALFCQGPHLYAGVSDWGVYHLNLFAHGEEVVLHADAAEGYHFEGWAEAGRVASLARTYRFRTFGGHSLAACLAPDRHIVTTRILPEDGGGVTAGEGWNAVALDGVTVSSVAVVGPRTYLGTATGEVWRHDPTASPAWSRILALPNQSWSIRSLVWDGSRLYAGVYGGSIWGCEDPEAAHPTWALMTGVYELTASLYADGPYLYQGGVGYAYRYDRYTWGWEEIGPLNGKLINVFCRGGDYLYAGDGWGQGVWGYGPEGNPTWQQVGLNGYSVKSLAFDGAYLYAGTEGHGVWRYDPSTGGWTDIGTGSALNGYTVLSLAWDGALLYAGTDGHGLWCRELGESSAWSPRGMDEYPLRSLSWDGFYYYAGTQDHGVWRYDPAGWGWADVSAGTDVSISSVRSLLWFGPHLYAGTSLGVWRLDPVGGAWKKVGQGDAFSLSSDGTYIYFGTYLAGVRRFDPADPDSLSHETAIGLDGYTVRSLAWDGSRLYAAVVDLEGNVTGVMCYRPEGGGPWTRIGLADRSVSALLWDRASLYAGTEDTGVWRYRTFAHASQVFLHALPEDGYDFTGWSRDASGDDNPVVVVVDGDKEVTANFLKEELHHILLRRTFRYRFHRGHGHLHPRLPGDPQGHPRCGLRLPQLD